MFNYQADEDYVDNRLRNERHFNQQTQHFQDVRFF